MKKNRKKHMLAAALLAALASVHAGCTVEVEEWFVYSRRLPTAFDGFRIVLLTDLHGTEFGPGSSRLLEAVELAMPDLIAISGDLADEATKTAMLEPLLQGLCAIAPTCFVTGNHEWVREDTEQLLAQLQAWGVTVLRNDFFTISRGESSVTVVGAEDPNGYADMEQPAELMARLRQAKGEMAFTVVLYHRNDALELWAQLGADVVLSGHGHGGVIRLPLVGALVGVDRKLFPKNAEGLYTSGDTTLAVSRGLGGVRLLNRPHLPVIILRSQP